MNLGRYETMLAEHGMRPFERIPWVNPETGRRDSRVLGKRPPMRWRVSVDEWERLEAMTREAHGWTAETYLGASFLFGWPIAPDDTLPPRSIVFEPELASRRDSPDTETASHG